jgi:hypothetical protein
MRTRQNAYSFFAYYDPMLSEGIRTNETVINKRKVVSCFRVKVMFRIQKAEQVKCPGL